MLLNLHVKNLALVEEADIEFGSGLNILSGETGAGKSIILGSVTLALGAKAGSEVIGRYGDYAFVELNFAIDDDNKISRLNAMDIFPDDGMLTISRRIMEGRSVFKVNGETVTAAIVKKITALLIDIHGQHDHQSLLYKQNHLIILDKYARDELAPFKDKLSKLYKEYNEARKELAGFTIDDEERSRNVSFLEFEINEIDGAELLDGEDEEVEKNYRRMVNSQKIAEQAAVTAAYLGGDGANASELVSRAYSALNSVTQYDEALNGMLTQLGDIDGLISDFNRELSDYMEGLDYDAEEFAATESRLDTINNIKSKYGQTIEAIRAYRDDAAAKLDFYNDYDNNLQSTRERVQRLHDEAVSVCADITAVRTKAAAALSGEIRQALEDLNFGQVKFEIEVRPVENISADGADEAEFMISVNPGEDLRPLAKIASGGELSRIMLGIKSVLANKDDTDTLIFDEIDTGISGRTAQKVSEKMALIARSHQVICITHLPQIAAMADIHFLIEKNIKDGFTTTSINRLSDSEIITELARMLGGSRITELVMDNAAQMKEFADNLKKH